MVPVQRARSCRLENRIWRIIAPFKGNGWIDSGQKTFGIGSVTIEAQPILAGQPTERGQFAWVKQTVVVAVQQVWN